MKQKKKKMDGVGKLKKKRRIKKRKKSIIGMKSKKRLNLKMKNR
jgi:hypothetical protein